MLIAWVAAYLVVSVAIGAWASRRVKTTGDFALAGRSLPLPVVIATTFATWFGSETVLGVPAKFVEGGVGATIEDPWCAAAALVIVGALLARRLYPLPLLTIGDYYRQRFGPRTELIATLTICASYVGWVAAQITALGLVFGLLSADAVGPAAGMAIGLVVVLAYTLLGGMWSVALTDFVQMMLIVAGLAAIAWRAADLAGGAGAVLDHAGSLGLLTIHAPESLHGALFAIAPAVVILLGSIPQQDVFQRVMCARDIDTAARGPVIGGLAYLAFAAVPAFIVVASLLAMPSESAALLERDPQRVLPEFVMRTMPGWLQVLFFGALLSAIMSTASATLLAPSTMVVQNLLRPLWPGLTDRQELRAMRGALCVVSAAVFAYAVRMQGSAIYDIVASSYEAPVVGAFVPLVFGVFWPRATGCGACWSALGGLGVWLGAHATPVGGYVPPVLLGLAAALAGIVAGSLGDRHPAGRETAG